MICLPLISRLIYYVGFSCIFFLLDVSSLGRWFHTHCYAIGPKLERSLYGIYFASIALLISNFLFTKFDAKFSCLPIAGMNRYCRLEFREKKLFRRTGWMDDGCELYHRFVIKVECFWLVLELSFCLHFKSTDLFYSFTWSLCPLWQELKLKIIIRRKGAFLLSSELWEIYCS
jgi:hypothetical protein